MGRLFFSAHTRVLLLLVGGATVLVVYTTILCIFLQACTACAFVPTLAIISFGKYLTAPDIVLVCCQGESRPTAFDRITTST